jgi:TRAP-type C4-dicarboxylate transport system substrate-binding protein
MKKFLGVVLVAFSLVAAGEVDAGPVQLRLASHLPPDHFSSRQIIDPLIEKVGRYSNGTVTVKNFPGGQLATVNGALNAVKSGIANMGVVGVGYVGDVMPLSTIAEIPAAFSDLRAGHAAYWQLVKDILAEAEFLPNGVRPIMLALIPQTQLVLSRNVKVDALSDLAGLKIRVPHSVAGDAVSALGMVPVEMPVSGLYLALDRGTVDGAVLPIASISAYKLEEVTEAFSTGLSLGSIGFFIVIAESDWQKLSPEQREALERAGDEIGTGSIATLLEAEDTNAQRLVDGSMNNLYLSDAVRAEIDEALTYSIDRWIETVSRRNALAPEIAEAFFALQSQ